jgi:hypothetical protein
MQKSLRFICLAITLVLSLSQGAYAKAFKGTKTTKSNMMLKGMVTQCHYYPEQCVLDSEYYTDGAGNGGGNEPPYRPKKPKKPRKPKVER